MVSSRNLYFQFRTISLSIFICSCIFSNSFWMSQKTQHVYESFATTPPLYMLLLLRYIHLPSYLGFLGGTSSKEPICRTVSQSLVCKHSEMFVKCRFWSGMGPAMVLSFQETQPMPVLQIPPVVQSSYVTHMSPLGFSFYQIRCIHSSVVTLFPIKAWEELLLGYCLCLLPFSAIISNDSQLLKNKCLFQLPKGGIHSWVQFLLQSFSAK